MMPTLSNGSELNIWEDVAGESHAAFLFSLTETDGDVSEPFGALPDYFFGWVSLAAVNVFDGFFAITGLTNDGKYEIFSNLDTYLYDNDGNFIRTLSDEAAYLSVSDVSVEAENPDDVTVTWTGANGYFGGENTQYGQHDITLVDGVLQPDTFVNHAPTVADSDYTVAAGQPLVDIEFAGSDADFDLLSYTIVDGPDHGTLELDTQFDGNFYPFHQGHVFDSLHYHHDFLANNQFDYVPEAGFVGTDTFTVIATDGQGNSNTATIAINVGVPADGPEYIALGNGADSAQYYDSDHAVLVAAHGGDDVLYGSAFNDSLNGGVGDDLLHGETGRDKLTGGQGVDRMQGGAGNDTFLFAAGDIADPLEHDGRFDHIIDFHGAGNSGPGEQDFLSFFGFGDNASLAFDHYASADQTGQIYRITDPDDPANSGLIMVQMADGVAQIARGDYHFF
jgi:serralysin